MYLRNRCKSKAPQNTFQEMKIRIYIVAKCTHSLYIAHTHYQLPEQSPILFIYVSPTHLNKNT